MSQATKDWVMIGVLLLLAIAANLLIEWSY